MNSATRVLNVIPASPGTSEQQFDQLLFTVAAVAMSTTTDDAKRPMTSMLAYLDTLLPGSMAVKKLKTRYAHELNQEASR